MRMQEGIRVNLREEDIAEDIAGNICVGGNQGYQSMATVDEVERKLVAPFVERREE